MKNTNNSITVESVIPLSPAQQKTLKALLKSKFGTEIYKAVLTPSLLGGIKITVGSTQYDASLQGKFAQLRSK